MKKIYKYLFIISFIILPFLYCDLVHADYKATVSNPSGASCSLKSGSTGYCYYKNSSLNSYVDSVIWLDTGDEVTVLENYPKVKSNNINICSDYYVYTSYYFDKKGSTYNGYYCNNNLINNDKFTVPSDLKTEFKNAGFPESYWSNLAKLKQAHPNWEFKALNTKLDFNTAVNNENSLGKSLIQVTSSVNDQGYLNTWSGSYNYYTDKFTSFDSSNWYAANYDTIAYYMDPRNFLKDMYVFQFEKLSYDNSISESNYKACINSIFSNDYLKNYTNDFYNGGIESKVNPIYLASLARQEVGNGSTPGTAINGKYNGMYNFYNIGASSGTDPVYNGLNFAANTDASSLRPWDTPYKAITGGAKWIAKNYINIGQDTIYFKKWDVVSNINSNSGSDYVHQYQTNIQAASSEATTTYKSYYAAGILDSKYIFYIPIYNNMPTSTSLPSKGNPNNYLSSLVINNTNIPDFDGAVTTYNYYLNKNNPQITISAKTVNDNAKISGTGTFNITSNTTKAIKVTAQNGDVKEYKINVILTDPNPESSIDILTTLNNAGIKNGDNYITGRTVGSDIKVIKDKILNANNKAVVILKDKNNKEINSGVVKTGDKLTITVNSESKTYEIVVYGDVNGDGKISAVDYVKIKNYIMAKTSINGAYKEAADVNKDGKISAVDYVKIKNNIMGKDTIGQ